MERLSYSVPCDSVHLPSIAFGRNACEMGILLHQPAICLPYFYALASAIWFLLVVVSCFLLFRIQVCKHSGSSVNFRFL